MKQFQGQIETVVTKTTFKKLLPFNFTNNFLSREELGQKKNKLSIFFPRKEQHFVVAALFCSMRATNSLSQFIIWEFLSEMRENSAKVFWEMLAEY